MLFLESKQKSSFGAWTNAVAATEPARRRVGRRSHARLVAGVDRCGRNRASFLSRAHAHRAVARERSSRIHATRARARGVCRRTIRCKFRFQPGSRMARAFAIRVKETQVAG